MERGKDDYKRYMPFSFYVLTTFLSRLNGMILRTDVPVYNWVQS